MGHLKASALGVDIAGRPLLRNVDFNAESGQLVAIVGPNGVGKTSLLRALGGVLAPASGTVTLDGIPVDTFSPMARARTLTLLFGAPPPPAAMLVRDVVALGRFPHRAWYDWTRSTNDTLAADAALRRVSLDGFGDRPFDTLSSGEQQRAWIALALAQGVTTLLLDEPTSHLDVRYAREVLTVLSQLAASGATVVVVLHDLNEAAAYADKIAILANGTLLAMGAPADVLTPINLPAAYGIRFEIVTNEFGLHVFPRAE